MIPGSKIMLARNNPWYPERNEEETGE